MSKFTGKLVNNTNTDIRDIEGSIRESIGDGRLPEELAEFFKLSMVDSGSGSVAVLDWQE